MKDADINSVMKSALTCLSKRGTSENELREQLTSEYSQCVNCEEVVEQVIARLHELHLIQENHLADQIATRHALKGNRYIRQKLMAKKIDALIISKTLAEIGSEEMRAKEAARKKWSSIKGKSLKERQYRLTYFLIGRGFPSDVCINISKSMK